MDANIKQSFAKRLTDPGLKSNQSSNITQILGIVFFSSPNQADVSSRSQQAEKNDSAIVVRAAKSVTCPKEEKNFPGCTCHIIGMTSLQ